MLAMFVGAACVFWPARAQTRVAPAPHFSVVSIRPWGEHERLPSGFVAGVQVLPGRVIDQCAGLSSLVYFAYRLTASYQVEGLPKWARPVCSESGATNGYSVQATMPAATTRTDVRRMMQSLLAARFGFAAHWETRQIKVLALAVATGGLKIKPTDPAKDPRVPRGAASCPADSPGCRTICCGSQTLAGLASSLSLVLGRAVIDRTGVSGSYRFGPYGAIQWRGEQDLTSSLPSLPTLLRERFGLELKSERGPVRVLVITRAARPLPN